jgi:transcription elongation factor Elf1
MKTCRKCLEEKEDDDFYVSSNMCKPCTRSYNRSRKDKIKEQIKKKKEESGLGCYMCNFVTHSPIYLNLHNNTKKHRQMINKYKTTFTCNLCGLNDIMFDDLEDHFNSAEHLSNI